MINNSEYFSFSKNEKPSSNAYNSLRGSAQGAVMRSSGEIVINVAGGFLKQQLMQPSHHSSLHSSNHFHRTTGNIILSGSLHLKPSKSARVSFADLSGDILDLISEYLPQSNENEVPPVFTMCSAKIMKSYCEYKRENYGIQVEILIDQIGELKRELFEYFDQKLFKMSKNL